MEYSGNVGKKIKRLVNHNMEEFDRDDHFHSLASNVTAKFSYTFRF